MLVFSCDCGQQLRVRDELAGRKVKCPKCKAVVTAPEEDEAAPPSKVRAGAPARSAPPQPAPPRRPRDDDDEAVTEEPRRGLRAARDDDRPRRRGRDEDYDEDDDRPRRRRQEAAGSSAALWIILSVVAFVLLVGGGVGAFFLLRSESPGKDQIAGDKKQDQIDKNKDADKLKDLGKKIENAALKMRLTNNFKEVGLALHNFHDQYRALPPAGFANLPNTASPKPNLSWRVAILPYINEQQLYSQFKLNESWDSPHNKQLLSRMPNVFAPGGKTGKGDHTHMQLLTGPNTVYPDWQAKPNLIRIADGTSNTILVVEASEAVPWTRPADVRYNPAGPLPSLGAFSSDGFFAALGDGQVRFVDRRKVSEKTIRLAIDPMDGQVLPPDWDN